MTLQADWDESALRARWERLGEDDVARIGGDRGRLVACLVDLYGWSREEAETEVKAWEREPAAPEGVADAPAPADADAVVQASADSFPASDPPGWIKQAPRAPRQASAPPQDGAEQPATAKPAPRRKRRS